VPLILIHGTKDENVPYSISADYYKRAKELGDPVELITLPDAAHFEVINPKAEEFAFIKEAVLKSLLDQ
jgi:dipeptidyl aminopeptidase/acylaminoacyl peptidase